jgi:hypothetical protein
VRGERRGKARGGVALPAVEELRRGLGLGEEKGCRRVGEEEESRREGVPAREREGPGGGGGRKRGVGVRVWRGRGWVGFI